MSELVTKGFEHAFPGGGQERRPHVSRRRISPAACILVVEDEFAVAMELKDHLEGLGRTVVNHVMTGAAATGPDLVLMDVPLKGYDIER